MALLKLGENPIQSLSDNTVTARLGQTLIDFVIDTLLTMHPWRFACHEYTIIKDENGDLNIPSDVLRIIKTDARLIENKIISDSDYVKIVAIRRVTPDSFPSYFASLVSTKLAMEFCIPLTSDQSVFRTLIALYESELQTAKFIDSTTSINSAIESFSLLDSRF